MSGCDYWSCFIHLAIKMKMRRIERQSQKNHSEENFDNTVPRVTLLCELITTLFKLFRVCFSITFS